MTPGDKQRPHVCRTGTEREQALLLFRVSIRSIRTTRAFSRPTLAREHLQAGRRTLKYGEVTVTSQAASGLATSLQANANWFTGDFSRCGNAVSWSFRALFYDTVAESCISSRARDWFGERSSFFAVNSITNRLIVAEALNLFR